MNTDCWIVVYPYRTYEVKISRNADEALHAAFSRHQTAYGTAGANRLQAMFRNLYIGNRHRSRTVRSF